MRQAAKIVLKKAGLYRLGKHIYDRILIKWIYPKSVFRITIKDRPVLFDTSTAETKKWFWRSHREGEFHEHQVAQEMLERLSPESTFLDVGAFLGFFTCMAAAACNKGQVHAFEMDRVNFGLLRGNVALNGFDNVRLTNKAVAGQPGIVHFRRDGDSANTKLSIADDGDCVVQSESIDNYVQANSIVPNVVKIDVEGAEVGVLQGAFSTLREFRPHLFIEVHPRQLGQLGQTTDDVLALLEELEYDVYVMGDRRLKEGRVARILIEPGYRFGPNDMLSCEPRAVSESPE